jgi:lipopolysaccharide biosynthesis glycosyltransferase
MRKSDKDGIVHIACGFDERMESPFLMLADSIKRRMNGHRKIVIHVLHTDSNSYCGAYLDQILSDQFDVVFYQVKNPHAGARMKNEVSAASYLRFLLPQLLDKIERVVYLDTDLIVLKDVSELYDTNLGDLALGAMVDYSIVGAHFLNHWPIGIEPNVWPVRQYMEEVVQLTDWNAYFNAGVLVMDLEQFRQRDIIRQCEEFVRRTANTRIFNDQDALNHVVNGAFHRLDPRWNVAASRKPEEFRQAEGDLAVVVELWRTDPWILHYVGPAKPWRANAPHTIWDHCYWREIAEGPMLPLLVEQYLDGCEREKITNLQSPNSLLARGKPKLGRQEITAYAKRFPGSSDLSPTFKALVENDAPWKGPRPLVIANSRFKHRGGVQKGEDLVFNLANACGHLIYGPYLWYPPGNYEVTFEISVSNQKRSRAARLVIEVVSDGNCFKAKQSISADRNVDHRSHTLAFELDGNEAFVEFRIFAVGCKGGSLSFHGVTLQSSPPSNLRAVSRAILGKSADVVIELLFPVTAGPDCLGAYLGRIPASDPQDQRLGDRACRYL